jgi:hypothetical protein
MHRILLDFAFAVGCANQLVDNVRAKLLCGVRGGGALITEAEKAVQQFLVDEWQEFRFFHVLPRVKEALINAFTHIVGAGWERLGDIGNFFSLYHRMLRMASPLPCKLVY